MDDWRLILPSEAAVLSPIAFALLGGVLVRYLIHRFDQRGSVWAGVGLGVCVVGACLALAVVVGRGLVWLWGEIARTLPVEWIFPGLFLLIVAFSIGYAGGVHDR